MEEEVMKFRLITIRDRDGGRRKWKFAKSILQCATCQENIIA
jgi:hypothetical protein